MLNKGCTPISPVVSVGKSTEGWELLLFSYCSHVWLMNSFQEGLH